MIFLARQAGDIDPYVYIDGDTWFDCRAEARRRFADPVLDRSNPWPENKIVRVRWTGTDSGRAPNRKIVVDEYVFGVAVKGKRRKR